MAEILGMMTELDALALALYAVVWGRWIDCEARNRAARRGVENRSRQRHPDPFLSIANKCLLQMAQIENEFGLTPSSRSRIRAVPPADVADPFERYLNNDRTA
jgi:P27 family predicted phage terminase small subunit